LTLDGTLNITDAGGFGVGDYTLMTYTSGLVDNGLVVGSKPNPSLTYSIIAGGGVVRLHVGSSLTAFESWQQHYFGCTNCPQAAANADPDGDGMSNTNEFLAGFDPTNSTAYAHIINVNKTGNNMNVTYLGANGDTSYTGGPTTRTNVLEFTAGTGNGSYTNSFTSTGQTNILSGGTGVGVVASFVETNGATGAARYHRVRVLVP
jgi:hypothetical protein